MRNFQREPHELDRLPPDADPYPEVLSVHPRFEIDEDRGVIVEKDGPTSSQLLDTAEESESEAEERTEPDLDVYADALLLVDALERHEVDVLEEMDTDALVNWLHHDRPVSGPFGSVQ